MSQANVAEAVTPTNGRITPAQLRELLAADGKAREAAAASEFNQAVQHICQEHRVTFHVGVTVWGDGRNTPQIVFVAVD
jgi:hypothetical protein